MSVLTALALSACGSTAKKAAPAAANATGVSSAVPQQGTTESQDSTLKYWTPQRLADAAARPKQLLQATAKPGAKTPSAEATGPEFRADGGEPTIGGSAATADMSADAATLHQGDHAWVWKKHGVAPARMVGLIAFVGADGNNYSCSGTVVNSQYRSLVWTAGHCVFEHGWDQRIVFVPDFHDGKTPLGVWPAERWFTTPQWYSSTNPNYDVGAILLPRWRSSGRPIADYTGYQGIAFNLRKYSWNILDFGYPGDLLPSGQRVDYRQLRYCTGRTYAISLGYPGPNELSLHCTLGHGASGGPWLAAVNNHGLGWVIGTNSTHNLRGDDMHAAFPGAQILALYKYANSYRP